MNTTQLATIKSANTKLIESTNLKKIAAHNAAVILMNNAQDECKRFIIDEMGSSTVAFHCEENLKIYISNGYMNFNLIIDGKDDRIAAISRNANRISDAYTYVYEMQFNGPSRIYENRPGIIAFKFYNELVDIFTNPKLLAKLKEYMELEKTAYDKVYEYSAIINQAERDIRIAEDDVKRSSVNSLIYEGSDIIVGTQEKQAFRGRSRRRGYYFTEIKITKMTMLKVYVEFISSGYYRDDSGNEDMNQPFSYTKEMKRFKKDEFAHILLAYKEDILKYNK